MAVGFFASLPDDVKVEILKMLIIGKDLARVDSVIIQLQLLVTEHDGELWKVMVMYETLGQVPKAKASFYDLDNCFGDADNWKERYLNSVQKPLPQDLSEDEDDSCESCNPEDDYFLWDDFDLTRLLNPRPRLRLRRSRCLG